MGSFRNTFVVTTGGLRGNASFRQDILDAGMVRLKREDRERQIIHGAIKFFSQNGFSGRTRDLAKELGITQPLLYRYFPSKQALIDRVYEELFLRRWSPAWPAMIVDRSLGLDERIRRFYIEFNRAIFSREWVRMFVYSGLDQVGYNRRVLGDLEQFIMRPLCVELRLHCGYADCSPGSITPGELEYAWELHGVAFYYQIRRHVYGLPVEPAVEELVENMISSFLSGAPAVLARVLGPPVQSVGTIGRRIPAE